MFWPYHSATPDTKLNMSAPITTIWTSNDRREGRELASGRSILASLLLASAHSLQFFAGGGNLQALGFHRKTEPVRNPLFDARDLVALEFDDLVAVLADDVIVVRMLGV